MFVTLIKVQCLADHSIVEEWIAQTQSLASWCYTAEQLHTHISVSPGRFVVTLEHKVRS